MGYATQLEARRFDAGRDRQPGSGGTGARAIAPSGRRPGGSESAGRAAAAAGRLLDSLLDGETDGRIVGLAARAWSLPERGRYAVVLRQAVGNAPVEQAKLPATIGGARVLWRPRIRCQIGIVVLGDAELSTVVDALPVMPGWRTGVGLPVEGLTSLFGGRQFAELAVRTLAGDGVACLQDRMTAALLASRPDLAGSLSGYVLAPLLELDRASRDLLLDTFSAWLAADGSVHEAARPLYCHRNTVLNRLRRLEKLTQRSLSVPKDLVELTLAVEAYRLRPGRP